MNDGHINILCGNLENAWQTKESEGSTTGLQDELVRETNKDDSLRQKFSN